MPDPFNDKEFVEADPEIRAVEHIINYLRGLDGLSICTALGILEMVRLDIFEYTIDYRRGSDGPSPDPK